MKVKFQSDHKVITVDRLDKVEKIPEYKNSGIFPIKAGLWEAHYDLIPNKEIDRVLSNFQGKKNCTFNVLLVEPRQFYVAPLKFISYSYPNGKHSLEKGYRFTAKGRNFYLVRERIYDESGFVAISDLTPIGVLKEFFERIYDRIEEIPDKVQKIYFNEYLCYESSIICIL